MAGSGALRSRDSWWISSEISSSETGFISVDCEGSDVVGLMFRCFWIFGAIVWTEGKFFPASLPVGYWHEMPSWAHRAQLGRAKEQRIFFWAHVSQDFCLDLRAWPPLAIHRRRCRSRRSSGRYQVRHRPVFYLLSKKWTYAANKFCGKSHNGIHHCQSSGEKNISTLWLIPDWTPREIYPFRLCLELILKWVCRTVHGEYKIEKRGSLKRK